MSARDCFISYASADLGLAKDLDQRLTAAGFSVWFDKARLKPGFDWHREIEVGCEEARVILPVLTPNWKKSDWTRFETYGHDAAIPLWFAGTWDAVITGPLSHFQAHDLRVPDKAKWTALFEAVRAALKQPVPEKAARIAQLRYRPNPCFVGRDEMLVQVCEELHTGHTAALTQGHIRAITAMGGIGKTTLASEYAHRFWRLYRQIFWVDARAGYESEFARICDALFPQAADKAVPPSEKANAALAELCGRTERLLVIDNAEDESSAMAWVPKSGGCHTLITSRFSAFSAAVKTIPVFVLEPEPARALLMRRAGHVVEGPELEACDTLAKELGYLPLALEIAAAYIEQQGAGYGFADYLTLYRSATKDLLAEKRLGSTEYPDAVQSTWTATVAKLPPEARAILRIAAFLAATPIPLEVFVTGADKVCNLAVDFGEALPLAETDNREVRMRTAAGALKAYSMAALTRDSLQFHTLVQTVERLNTNKADRDKTIATAVKVLNGAFPDVEFNDWPRWELLCTHVESIIPLAPDSLGSPLGELLNDTAGFLEQRYSRFEQAEAFQRRALKVDEACSGSGHPDVARDLNNLAMLLKDTNRASEAEPLFRRALHIVEVNQGPNHWEFARALANLALLLRDTEHIAEAEAMFEQALKIAEADARTNPQVLMSIYANLAGLLSSTDRMSRAEELYRHALTVGLERCGPRHPLVACCMTSYAGLLWSTDRIREAAVLNQKALEIDEEIYGRDSYELAVGLTNMARMCEAAKLTEQAGDIYERVLVLTQRTLGPRHPKTAEACRNFANVLSKLNRDAEAAELFKKALDIDSANQGPNGSDVPLDLYRLATVFLPLGRISEVKPLLQRALSIRNATAGSDDELIKMMRCSLALLDDYEESARLGFWGRLFRILRRKRMPDRAT